MRYCVWAVERNLVTLRAVLPVGAAVRPVPGDDPGPCEVRDPRRPRRRRAISVQHQLVDYSRYPCIINISMTRLSGLELVDLLAAEGLTSVSTEEVSERLGLSPQAASNVLARLSRDGLVERVRRGIYLLHPLGELGVAATASDRIGEAVALAVGDREHRIAYRTALHEHGLLTRPGRRIQVAVSRRLYVDEIGGCPLESIIEMPTKIHIGAAALGLAWISTIERALLESAHLPRRVGGIATLAEALAASQPSTAELVKLSKRMHLETGLRRLASLDDQLGLGKLAAIDLPTRISQPLALDPSDPRDDGPIDTRAGVRWPGPIEELAEVVNQ